MPILVQNNQYEGDLTVRLQAAHPGSLCSVYELGKIARLDISNLNKIILFFEEVGVIRIRESKVSGRSVKTPVVDYDQIQFNLRVA
jgi:predicted transcriptional regulator